VVAAAEPAALWEARSEPPLLGPSCPVAPAPGLAAVAVADPSAIEAPPELGPPTSGVALELADPAGAPPFAAAPFAAAPFAAVPFAAVPFAAPPFAAVPFAAPPFAALLAAAFAVPTVVALAASPAVPDATPPAVPLAGALAAPLPVPLGLVAVADPAAIAVAAGDAGGGETLPVAGNCSPLDPPSCALGKTGLRAAGFGAALCNVAAKSLPSVLCAAESADAAPPAGAELPACAGSLMIGGREIIGMTFIPAEIASDVPSPSPPPTIPP